MGRYQFGAARFFKGSSLAEPTNAWLTTNITERAIPLEARAIYELRSHKPAAAVARIADYQHHSGADIERFAAREGRSRELLIYFAERAARHMRTWRARGFSGTLYVSLRTEDLEDRTLATSFDVIAKSQSLDASTFTVIVPLTEYLSHHRSVAGAVARIRKAGCGVAMAVNGEAVKFNAPSESPFTALLLGGKGIWRRLRTIGPGKLGALGSWLGWAESQGLARTAVGIASAQEEETARLYGFSHAEGSHYSAFAAARTFMATESEISATPPEVFPSDLQQGLPPRPGLALKSA